MNSSRHFLVLVPLLTSLPVFAADQRGGAPAVPAPPPEVRALPPPVITPGMPAPPITTNLPAVQAPGAIVVPQQPAAVSRQPTGAAVPRLQPMTGPAMGGQLAPASPVQSAPQLPGTGTPFSATPFGAMPSAPAMPAIPAPQLPGAFVAVPPAPKAPSTPLPADVNSPLSDYAIGVGTEVSEGKWTFTIRNVGLAEPKFKPGSKQYASVSFAVGKPCATTGDWHKYPWHPLVPTLGPGKQADVSFSMEKAHINNACKIKAEIDGPPANDINLANHLSITPTKAVFLPDLIVTNREEQGSAKWPAGGSIVIKNIGNAPAGPSKFNFYCGSKDPDVPCGTWGEKFKTSANHDYSVPALKPGESYSVVKPVPGIFPGTPVKVSWSGTIDPKNEIKEHNEQNNHDSLNPGGYF